MWSFLVLGLVAWLIVALLGGLALGRMMRVADDRDARARTVEVAAPPPAVVTAPRVRRRVVPLPPLGIALVAVAVALETAGYLARLYEAPPGIRSVLSMEAPLSLPRLYVTALFAAAALAALAGAGVLPGRRTWWTGVGLVAAGIALIKGGSTLHRHASNFLNSALGATFAVVVSAVVAVAVIAALWFASRTERRDRRRVLGVLSAYAVASVGVSGVTGALERSLGMRHWVTISSTYVEETAEALCGVAFLVAVLVGVAPRLVLPADWVLRRSADAHTLDLPEQLPIRADGVARG